MPTCCSAGSTPTRPIGKRAALDVAAAERAIARDVALPLGLSPLAAAEAILRVANSRMAGAIRLVSIERGHDPRAFALMPFGGGGGLHAGALVREVGLARALVPRFPGVTSALGCVIADLRHDVVVTVNTPLAALDPKRLEAEVAARIAEGGAVLDGAGVTLDHRQTEISVDMLYQGQTHTIAVPVARPETGGLAPAALEAAFETAYRAAFGRTLPGIPIRVLNLHVAVIGCRPTLDLSSLAPGAGSLGEARRGSRQVWFAGTWHEAPVFDRLALPVGQRRPRPRDPGAAGHDDLRRSGLRGAHRPIWQRPA